jgi:hypothetical protein
MESTTEPIRAHICIVPNSLSVRDEHECVSDMTGLGFQVCFQSYISNDDCENFANHTHPKVGRMSEYIPVVLFYGKKEGDEVELTINGVKIIVTCNQLETKWTERFEDAMYDRTQSFGGVYNDKNCPRILQYSMMIVTHFEYAKSIGRPFVEPTGFRYASSYQELCKEECQKTPHMSYLERMNRALST